MSDIVNSSLKTAVKGTAQVFLGMVISILLWFATKILIIRNTTKEELGIYSLVVSLIGIFSLLGTLGLHEGIARYVSLFLGEGKKDEAAIISRNSLHIGAIVSLMIFLLMYIFSGIISRYIFYKPELEYPIKIIAFFIPFSVMTSIMIGILRGFNVPQSRIYADAGQPLIFLIFMGISFILHFSFEGVIYAYVFSMAVIFIFMIMYGIRKIRMYPLSKKIGDKSRELIRFSLPLLTVSMLSAILNSTDTLMLGRYTDTEQVGVYNVSISLARLLIFPLTALGFVFMPLAGKMFSRGQMPELKRTYQVLTKWIFSATLPIFFILFFFSEMTITFLFGERFIVSSTSLKFLLIGFLFYSFTGVSGMLMMVIGKSVELMNIYMFGTFVNILLNYIMIKLSGLGIAGAAVATLISYILINSMISLKLYRESRMHPFTPEYIKPIVGSAIIGVMIYGIAKSLPLYLWMMPLYFIIFFAGYCVSLLVTRSLDKEDIMLFSAILERMGMRFSWLQRLTESSLNESRKN